MAKKIRVLFVCMGNICRSPLAHGYFEALVAQRGWGDRVEVDSGGTHAYHVGRPPDERSQEVAQRHGVAIESQRARLVTAADFNQFDYILAMDRENLRILKQQAPASAPANLHLLLEFAAGITDKEVPDPYYGGRDGFEQVYRLVEEGVLGFAAYLAKQHPLSSHP